MVFTIQLSNIFF